MESTAIESGVERVGREQEFRRRWYEAHASRLVADERGNRQAKATWDEFHSSGAKALELLDELARTGDLESFKKGTQKWAPTAVGFKGTIGQMTLNILVKRADEPDRVARLLVESLRVPESDEEAFAKVGALADYARTIKKGASPGLANVPFILSYFWGLADHELWPVIWPSGAVFVEFLTGTSLPSDPVERYRAFLEGVREVSTDNSEFEMTAAWWNECEDGTWMFLDKVLMDRAVFGFDQSAPVEERETNARALVTIADYWGDWLVEEVSEALGRELKYSKPQVEWRKGRPRGDLWVEWFSREAPGLGIRVWVTNRGAAVALRPGLIRKGKDWREEVAPILESADYPGCRVLGGPSSYIGEDVGLGGAHLAEFVYGRWFEREQFAEVDLAATVVEVAELLKPLYDELLNLAVGEPLPVPVDPASTGDPLFPFVEEYRAESGYPTPADEKHRSERRGFAERLAPDALFDLSKLRRIWNTGAYGRPGPMPELNRSFGAASDVERQRMFDAIQHLCWGRIRMLSGSITCSLTMIFASAGSGNRSS